MLNFSWSCSGTGSSCCFSHSLYTCWHFDQNILTSMSPFNTPRASINYLNIASLTSAALDFLPPPFSRNLFLDGSSSTISWFLLLYHILSCIFQPPLQTIFLPNYTFFNSNKCFSHFNVQQLLSSISHFVLLSQPHLKITLKKKTF